MSRVFNVTPKPAMLRGEQSQKWHVTGALAEICDNSFGPGRGDASAIIISYDTKTRVMTILDNGRGMDAIGRLFQLGNTIGRAVGDIGEFGAGGTKAILWLASKVEIWTLRDNKVQSDAVVWSDWARAPDFSSLGVCDEWRPPSLSNTPAELLALHHGTMIRLHLLQSRKFQISHVIRDLSRTYSTGLRSGKRITWQTLRGGREIEEPRALTDPFVRPSDAAKTKTFDFVIEYTDRHDEPVHLAVRGVVTLDENTPQSESRVQIGYGFRIIRSATECYQSADGTERYVGTGVSGWIDLGEGWQQFLATTKDAIDDTPLFETLMQCVFEEIKPLLKEAERQSFDLQFTDLAIGLQKALNTRDGDIVVETATSARHSNGHGDSTWSTETTGPMPDITPPEQPSDQPGPVQRPAPPALRLLIIPTPDKQMEGALCCAKITGNDIIILTNEDHAVVQEAMKSKPINRMALNLMTIGELAESIAALDQSDRMIKRLFKPALASTIIDLETPRDRARAIGRQLMDRVRNPMPAEPEETAAAA